MRLLKKFTSKVIDKILRLIKKFTKIIEKFLNKILNFYQCEITMINHENWNKKFTIRAKIGAKKLY